MKPMLLGALMISVFAACDRGGAAPAAQEPAAGGGVSTAAELVPDQVGQQAVCPVTGQSFTVREATAAADYQGEVYLFCCAGCAPEFLANPAQYGAPAPAAP